MPKRRANGEGSLYKRRDGRWVAAITVAGRRRLITSRTRGEAQTALAGLIRARAEGAPLHEDQTPLGAYLGQWLADVSPGLAAQTVRRYRSAIETHIAPALGRLPLGRLTPGRVQELYRELHAAGLAPATIRVVHSVLHAALGRAEKWRLIARNPTDLVDLPRTERPAGRRLSLEEARHFLAAAETDPHGAYWTLALTTGLRPGELLGLRWADVDLAAHRLTVRATLVRDGGLRVQERPKGGRSRVVPLLPQAVAALRRHRQRQAAERLAATDWLDLDLVFPNGRGRPTEPGVMRLRLWALLREAGLPEITPHTLRHSTASLLVSLGVDVVTVAGILGHSHASLTLDRYSHAAPDDAARAIRRLGAALEG